MEIKFLKEKLQNKGNISPNTNDNNIKNLELQISFLKQENSFIKIELQNKQKIINKTFDLNWFQSKDQCSINCSNKNDKKVAGTPNHVNGKPLIGNKTIASDRRNQNPEKSQQTIAENKSTNHDGKTLVSKNNFSTGREKVTLVGDSMTKFVRCEELSSKQSIVKVLNHPGSTSADMVDYIKAIVRRKPDALVIHTGTNDMTNDVNTLKHIRKLLKVIRQIDVDEEIKIGLSNVICRIDKNLEKERMEINTKLKK